MPRPAAAVLAAALAAALAAVPTSAEITWRERYWNPQPLPDDFVLPMPCGGAMAFRRIDTSSADGPIGDVARTLGLEGDDQPYLNGLRRAFVAGSFGEAGASHFYMAKYELAEAQVAAVMAETCPDEPRRRAFLPATERSHLEFEAFAERYTLWLMEAAPGALPTVGDATGFLRLPTEDEWEFAARGGQAVEPVAFRQPLPPVGEGENPSEYIAHGGTGSAGGTVQVIGTLKPNPLGLHDMIGNAAEMVATPFAVVRHGRLHGRPGGFVKRGGDARTPLASLTSATRFEVPPFDALSQAPARDRYLGTRLVIAALAITSPAQADALADGLRRLAEVDASLPSAASEEAVMALIGEMQAEAASPRARSQLALVRATMERARAERNEQRDKSIRLLLGSGALVCDQTVLRMQNVLALDSLIPSFDQYKEEAIGASDTALLEDIEAAEADAFDRRDEAVERADGFRNELANMIEALAEDYPGEALARQQAFLETTDAMRDRRLDCLRLFADHIAIRRAAGLVDLPLLDFDLRKLVDKAVQ